MADDYNLKRKVYPTDIDELIKSSDIEKICNSINVQVFSGFDTFSMDLNLIYEGYKQHKRLNDSKKNSSYITAKQEKAELNKINTASNKLIQTIRGSLTPPPKVGPFHKLGFGLYCL